MVWSGRQTGIFNDWPSCEAQVKGFQRPQYKSFTSLKEAQRAFQAGAPADYYRPKSVFASALPALDIANPPDYRHDTVLQLPPEVEARAWAVDAACSGNPGMMEYRCVDLSTGAVLFQFGPIFGTNNIGEFLAIVHALALQEKQHTAFTIYSDSRNALLWVNNGKCKTRLALTPRTKQVWDLVDRAEKWLHTHSWSVRLLKWDTKHWGEIPADFGRK